MDRILDGISGWEGMNRIVILGFYFTSSNLKCEREVEEDLSWGLVVQ